MLSLPILLFAPGATIPHALYSAHCSERTSKPHHYPICPVPTAHCSRGTIKILREQEKHTTIPCAPRILLRRNHLDSERTRMTTHSSRTTCKEERTELTWYCGAASEIIKVLHHECKWRTQVQVSPLHFRVLAFYWRGLV